MKTIAFILYSFDAGGVERMTLHLAENYIKRGYKVDLVVMHPTGEYTDSVPSGVCIVPLSKVKARAALPGLISYFRKKKPDIICSAKDYLNVLVILAKKISQLKATLIVSSRVHLSEQAKQDPSANRTKKWVLRTYRYADHVVGVSRGVSSDIQAIARLPVVHTIYNPVITKSLSEKMNQPIHHPFLSDSSLHVFVTVGRLHKQKDYVTLLRAFALVHKRNPHTALILVGDGEEREDLETFVVTAKLQNAVSFVGYQHNPYPYMKQADVFVLSSLYEGFGNVLVEAMAAGTQIVSTDCPSGPKEILKDGMYGHLIPVGNYEALAMAMESALLNPVPAEALIQRAHDFTVDTCANHYEKLWL
ncbi:glycosyltransferase [Shouchella miscanthi]|uniref:Glycosyltransferase n=1 Tax=Shouchella miscanthi TaxID=2598861 RepID=A0ABU6NJY5_9BACI|nr:glycosyltransferase [Shouchella miscanthi]